MVAVDDQGRRVGLGVELLEAGGDGAHGDEVGAFDAADLPFHVLADVDETDFFAGFAAVFDFAGREFVGEFLIGHGSFHCRGWCWLNLILCITRGLGKGLE